MVYIIVKGEVKGKVLLVKAESKEEIEQRLNLAEDEEIAATFTTSEMQALESSSFCIIAG